MSWNRHGLAGLLLVGVLAVPAVAQEDGRSIKIGVLSDISGPYSDLGGLGSAVAARLAGLSL